MRLRQPSQNAWPHTRMRGTTPSLRHTTILSESERPGRRRVERFKNSDLDLNLLLLLPPS
jgi:hypothetical protein